MCKIFIWDQSVPPMLKYNIGYSAENPEWVGTLKD